MFDRLSAYSVIFYAYIGADLGRILRCPCCCSRWVWSKLGSAKSLTEAQINTQCTSNIFPSGSACICVYVWFLIFLQKHGELEYQKIRTHKIQILEIWSTNKSENASQRCKREKTRLAFWGAYNLNQILARQIIRESIICTHIPFSLLHKYILSYDACRIFATLLWLLFFCLYEYLKRRATGN